MNEEYLILRIKLNFQIKEKKKEKTFDRFLVFIRYLILFKDIPIGGGSKKGNVSFIKLL